MDPNFEAEQPDLSPDAKKTEDGALYLRRLKTQKAEDAPVTPAATSSIVVPAATDSPGFKERRRSPRLKCAGSAEFRPEGSDVRMWGTLTDISLHGCYVEMNNTFPVETRVNLSLEALGISAFASYGARLLSVPRDGHVLYGNRTRTAVATGAASGRLVGAKLLNHSCIRHLTSCQFGPLADRRRCKNPAQRAEAVFRQQPPALARRVLRDHETGSPLNHALQE